MEAGAEAAKGAQLGGADGGGLAAELVGDGGCGESFAEAEKENMLLQGREAPEGGQRGSRRRGGPARGWLLWFVDSHGRFLPLQALRG